ncbi:MAG: hypothetical protein ACOY9C_02065 [Pseudomonadota bacterium]
MAGSICRRSRLRQPAGVVRTGYAAYKRLARSVALVVVPVALSGCITAAEMAARHRQACLTYGFTPGTDAYANCLLQLDIGDYGYSHHGRARPRLPRAFSAPAPAPVPPGS